LTSDDEELSNSCCRSRQRGDADDVLSNIIISATDAAADGVHQTINHLTTLSTN